MKLKHLLGIAFAALVGGFLAYQLLNKKENGNTASFSDDSVEDAPSRVDLEQDNFVVSEEKCDSTMRQAYENMSVRNEEAKQILSNIHDEMKTSEDNIAAKKADIQKMMENLKR